MREPRLILGVGELLWDLLPDGARLGGAPANFTVMAGRLGNHAVVLSRIGRDDLGRKAVETLDPLPTDTSHLQIDPGHETGRATVEIQNGQPEFVIHEPAAWDSMELREDWVQLAERADAICFGSLAQRSRESRQTIQTLVAQTPGMCVRIFDVNLRAPFYSSEVVQESLELATMVKMNDAEVPLVISLLGLQGDSEFGEDSLQQSCGRLLGEFPALNMVAVTRGGHGSFLMTRDEWSEHPGVSTKVADTIGAGDAFTAAMTHYILRGADLETMNEAGNRWGAWVASQSGAMPYLSDQVKLNITAAIERPA